MSKSLNLILILLLLSCSQKILFQDSYQPKEGIDERLGNFLNFVIEDEDEFLKVKNQYNGQPISFEYFIYQLYTNKIKFDTTEVNSLALAQMGQYLEEKRPVISKDLYNELKKLNLDEKDMMRGMFLMTLKALSE